MKKFLIILTLLFAVSTLYSDDVGSIDIVYKGKTVGSMPVMEFKEIVLGAEKFSKLVSAEKDKRIIIELKDSPMQLNLSDEYTTDVYIKWLDKKHIVIKTLVLENKITLKRENFSKYRVVYRNVSEYGFPISTGFLLLLLIFI